MENSLNTIETTSRALSSLNKEQVDLLKRTVCKGSTDDEFALFLHVCQRTRLDPFARQIYAVKRWNSKTQREDMSIQTGIDGYRLTAERTGCYAPGREPTFTFDGGKLVSATAYIKKFVGGSWHEIAATAFYDEYVQKGKDGNPNVFWFKMPKSQLAKCAEALAIRRGFPNELSGLYTDEEMGQANETREAKPAVSMPTLKVKPALPEPVSENNTNVSTTETEEVNLAPMAISGDISKPMDETITLNLLGAGIRGYTSNGSFSAKLTLADDFVYTVKNQELAKQIKEGCNVGAKLKAVVNGQEILSGEILPSVATEE